MKLIRLIPYQLAIANAAELRRINLQQLSSAPAKLA